MKKYIFIVFLAVILLCGCRQSDSSKFKNEYEELNEKENDNGQIYRAVEIKDNINIKYKTAEEIIDVIKNETAVIYFGFAKCPWCRTMIENLISVTDKLAIENVYYLDVSTIRNVLQLDDNGNIIEKYIGSISYYEIVDLLKDVLNDYVLTDSNGNQVNTGTKRIYAPNVVAVKDGKILGLTDGVGDNVKDPYGELTEEMNKSSYNKIYDLVSKINPTNVCIEGYGC